MENIAASHHWYIGRPLYSPVLSIRLVYTFQPELHNTLLPILQYANKWCGYQMWYSKPAYLLSNYLFVQASRWQTYHSSLPSHHCFFDKAGCYLLLLLSVWVYNGVD